MNFGFVFAVGLFIAILLMPFLSSELRQNRSMIFGYWFVISLHQIVAFTNAYFFTTPGANNDAFYFHEISSRWAMDSDWSFTNNNQQIIFTKMLATVYRFTGPSHLLGEQLSIFFFALSCILFLKIMQQLNLVQFRLASFLVFGSLPTMVLLGSVTMRESYQIFFFMLTVYLGIKMHKKGGINTYFFGMILSCIASSFFHRAMFIYSIFLIILFIVWTPQPTTYFWNIKKLRLAAFIILPLLLMGMNTFSNIGTPSQNIHFPIIAKFVDTSILETLVRNRENLNAVEGATNYGMNLDPSSPVTVVYSSLKIYFFYLFAPLPWQVKNPQDFYAGFESILRMILICFSLTLWISSNGSKRRLLGLMLILYFSMTFLWGMGTANYGTSIRHHMVSWWIIAILGIPPLMEKLTFFSDGIKHFIKIRTQQNYHNS